MESEFSDLPWFLKSTKINGLESFFCDDKNLKEFDVPNNACNIITGVNSILVSK